MKINLSINSKKRIEQKKEGNTVVDIPIQELNLKDRDQVNKTFRNYVHSTNVWKKGTTASKDNYRGMVGIPLDYDDGIISLKLAREYFADYKHILYTSSSHQEDKPDHNGIQDRFRVILLFDPSEGLHYTDFDEADRVFSWAKRQFDGIDAAILHRGSKLFPNANPDESKYLVEVNDKGEWFSIPPEDLDRIEKQPELDHSEGKKYINYDTQIVLKNGNKIILETLRRFLPTQPNNKAICYCPFCDDINSDGPSAFVQMTPAGFIGLYCSHCKSEYEKGTDSDRKSSQYYYSEDPVEPGMFMLEDKLMRVQKSRYDAHIVRLPIDYVHERQQKFVKTYLARRRNIASAKLTVERYCNVVYPRVDFVLEYSESKLMIQIPSPIKPTINDNKFVDAWLEELFGEYNEFIKQWLAVYCFTNFKRLPVIVLTGERGVGKTTFAEVVSAIFPDQSADWSGEHTSFNSYFEKKLLVVDENNVSRKEQYTQLKAVTGNDYLTVNQKFKPEYRVRNNTHIILTTNEKRPLYLTKDEMPVNEHNNNFFIYEINRANTINPHIKEQLLERLGTYIHTELRKQYKVWNSDLNKNKSRYSIPCPITQLEKHLFESASTSVESDADLVAEAIVRGYPLYGERFGGGDHIKKLEFQRICKGLGMKQATHQNAIFHRLQDIKVLSAGDEIRESDKRFGWKILRRKDYYGEDGNRNVGSDTLYH
ncbi:DUF5906 domain-containing protein [bacterium]|nr:DUF5906 domain-containing protein [bacterium]